MNHYAVGQLKHEIGGKTISVALDGLYQGTRLDMLKSRRAIQVNIEIMRAFVRLRQILASNAQLARRLDALEKKYDAQFKVVFDAIRQLMTPPELKKKKIGFLVEEKPAHYGKR